MLDEKILGALKSGGGSYVSGEELCKLADISRAAIWKHIEKLREEGYDIEAVPHLGYRLRAIPDRLTAAEIRWALSARALGREIISYGKVDSTNDVAYGLAGKGAGEGLVIIAEEQAKGKGRLGRHWVSPPKAGVYMSIVLRPLISPNEIPKITLLAAVAVASSVRELTGLEAMIKWPNDILVNDRKVCGILTEMKAEQDSVGFVIVGIGINVNTPLKALPKGASSLKEEMPKQLKLEAISRIELARRVLEKMEMYYNIMKKEGFAPVIKAWKGLSAMPGARVRVTLPGRAFEGQVQDISSDGALIVRCDSGILNRISSGDVMIIR